MKPRQNINNHFTSLFTTPQKWHDCAGWLFHRFLCACTILCVIALGSGCQEPNEEGGTSAGETGPADETGVR